MANQTPAIPPRPSPPRPSPPRPSPPRQQERLAPKRDRTLLGFALCFTALIVGLAALKLSPVANVGPYGLIQALSPLYYLAIGLLLVSFAMSLQAKWRRSALLGTHLAILVFLVHGAPAIIEKAARFQTAYVHVGFVDYIANTGQLLPAFDARFNWPSFFEAAAVFDKVAGIGSAETLLQWWPTAMNLLYLPLIWSIANQFLKSELKAWVATAIFPLVNWEAQDYFSPQSLNYLLYLTFVFILVVPLGARDRPGWHYLLHRTDNQFTADRQPRPSSRPGSRRPRPLPVGFHLGALVLLMAAMATGHQLTPMVAIVTTMVLVATGRTKAHGMALIVPLMAIGWVCYGAIVFWSGHISMFIGGLGNVGGNVNSGVANRASGSSAHALAGHIRELISVLVWGLALLGALVWKTRTGERAAVLLLFLSSFSLIAGGNYGGEGVLRVYLFSLPGAVILIAALITRFPELWHGQVALTCTLLLIMPLFLVARWGNELYEMVLPNELTAQNVLYQIAAPGSNLISLNDFLTWRYKNIVNYNYANVGLGDVGPHTLSEINATVTGNPRGGYVIVTADQVEYGWLVQGMPQNWGATVENMLAHSPNYKLRYANADAEVFQYIPDPKTVRGLKTTKTAHR